MHLLSLWFTAVNTHSPNIICLCEIWISQRKNQPKKSNNIYSAIYQFTTFILHWDVSVHNKKKQKGNEDGIIAEWLAGVISPKEHCAMQLICEKCQKQQEKMILEIWDCLVQIWWNGPQLRSYMASLGFYKWIVLAWQNTLSQNSHPLKIVPGTWHWLQCTPVAFTVSRSQASRAPLGSSEQEFVFVFFLCPSTFKWKLNNAHKIYSV